MARGIFRGSVWRVWERTILFGELQRQGERESYSAAD